MRVIFILQVMQYILPKSCFLPIYSFSVIQRVFSLLVVLYGRTQMILRQFQG